MIETEPEIQPKKDIRTRKIVVCIFVITSVSLALYAALILCMQYLNTPTQYDDSTQIEIPEGTSGSAVTEILKETNLIKSSLYAKYIVYRDSLVLQAGVYRFPKNLTTGELLEAIANGIHNSDNSILITFPEGLRGETMLPIINEFLPHIENLTAEELDSEIGYLFPDTYFFDPEVTKDRLMKTLRETYDKKTSGLTNLRDGTTGYSENDLIILASLVEREANSEESMKMVAGVLINRLEIDMGLQVDATFEYLLGKESVELTAGDLAIDSPYNTYLYRGLPPTPIANPGLMAIKSVLNPIDHDYLYYLTGTDGNFYFAETFDQHKRNKERYLR